MPDGSLGTMTVGSLADVVFIDGNPLEEIQTLQDKSKIISIMKNGQLYFNLLDDKSPHLFLPTECADIIKKKLQT